jgi:hypothetical protein
MSEFKVTERKPYTWIQSVLAIKVTNIILAVVAALLTVLAILLVAGARRVSNVPAIY